MSESLNPTIIRSGLIVLAVATVIGCGGGGGGASSNRLDRIYYEIDETGFFEVFSMNLEGVDKDQITFGSSPGFASNAFPNSNGSVVYFQGRDSDLEIYSIRLADSVRTNLTSNTTDDILYDVDRANGRIVFRSNRNGTPDLYSMGTNGSSVVRLTNSGNSKLNARFQPGGEKIVYTETSGNSNVWVVNKNGSGAINLTNDSQANRNPEWSPDGTKIAFSSNGFIQVMNADGTGRFQLTNTAENDLFPTWSPDGNRIVFQRENSGLQSDLWIVNANGSNITRLTATTENEAIPRFTTDGSRIVFESSIGSSVDIVSIRPDGTNRVILVDIPGIAQNPKPF